MLADKTNTYENSKSSDKKQKRAHLEIQYQSQTYEKTKSIIGEELEKSFDTENYPLESAKYDSDVQRSLCLQESEIQRLSQAYADKYYYEMKFEQYQNLLAQQQTTITKLLNEKRELQQKLESNPKLDCGLQTDLQDDYNKLIEEFSEYREAALQKEAQQAHTIQCLSEQLQKQSQRALFEEVTKQMNQIKEQNNFLFQQLREKEEMIEQGFLNQIQEIEDRMNQDKLDLQEEFENQLQMKEELIHQQELQVAELNSQVQQLYSDNLQLQNQLDLLNSNYQEDIQQQANLLQQQVSEYKIVINNLENQLFLMNAEIQRRGRSASKDQRMVSNYIKFNYQRPSNEMTFASITPSGKKF